jgi:hypothetical protein
MHTKFWFENLKGRDLSDLGIVGKVLDWILGKQERKMWTGCSRLRMGASGGLL